MEWIILAISVVINMLVVGGGLLFHYAKTETRNEERHKRVTSILDDHEQRLSSIEDGYMRKNGQSTYISREECHRTRDTFCRDVDEAKNKLNNHETRLSVVEQKVG